MRTNRVQRNDNKKKNMFSEELKNISWDETTERIAHMTDNDVSRPLAKDHRNVDDFMALNSPAATP